MERLKVCFIVDKSAPLFTGGYEVRVFALARALSAVFDVRIYTCIDGQSREIENVRFVRLAPMAFQTAVTGGRSLAHGVLFAASLTTSPFRDWVPDAIVVESIPYLHLATMARWVSRSKSVFILNVNEAWSSYRYVRGLFSRPASIAIRRLLSVGLSWADIVMAVSNVTATSLLTNYRVDRVEVVPMGVDLTQITGADTQEISGSKYDFVAMGRFVGPKRFSDLLWALSRLRIRHNWRGRACLIGDGPLFSALVEQAHRLGLAKSVDFVGFLQGDQKYHILRRSRVFVLPSEREGFSLATLEALACGLPAVVAVPPEPEVFGASDFVTNGKNGLYYNLGDIDMLSQTLANLLEHEGLRGSLSRAARSTALRYDWNLVAKQLDVLIRSSVRTG